MHKDRIKQWIHQYAQEPKKYILYWMQQSQRVNFNHALEFAIEKGNQLSLPIVVCFSLISQYPDANLSHYQFMLEGLKEVKEELTKMGIGFVIKMGNPVENIVSLAKDAAILVLDYGYLKHQLKWRKEIINTIWQQKLSIDVVEIESDVIVPVLSAYPKAAYGAYAIRSSLMKKMDGYLDYLLVVKKVSKDGLLYFR